jgi:cobaltochelatase CobS
VFNIDEVDNASGSTLTTLNSALANGHAAFPCGMVERHPDFVCIATGNTVGLGGTQDYQERRNLDGAFRQRFAFVDWPYSEQVEDAMTRPYCPDKADIVLRWVRDVRKAAKAKKVHGILATPASAQRLAQDLQAGFLTPMEAAYAHVWKGVDESTARGLGCGMYPGEER